MRRVTLAALMLLILSLALSACTLSASQAPTPTTTGAGAGPGGGGGLDGAVPDATMAALGTEVARQMTVTAEAAGPGDQAGPGEPVGGATPIDQPTVTPLSPVVAATATPVVPAIPTGCSNPYIVKGGDWIYKIARECNVAPSALIAANPGINPDRIKPGQALNMPAAGATPVPGAPAAICTGTYTVRQGDNLFRLAYNCGLTTEELARLNNIPFPYDRITPGQVIRYP